MGRAERLVGPRGRRRGARPAEMVHQQHGHQPVRGGGFEDLDVEQVRARVRGGSSRLLITDRVRVGGATEKLTTPSRRPTAARQRWIRLASA